MGIRSPLGHGRLSQFLQIPISPLLTITFWATVLWPALVVAKITPFLPQGFMFDWTPDGQTPPIPTTAQCDTIHIKWQRGSQLGPNPTAPYYLQIYTSTFVVPFVIEAGSSLNFDWVVPFIPGTQYQICMFDSLGTSGGCQAVYTVYQAPNTTLDDPPTCFNLTYPRPETQLGVTALVSTGPFSQFGWIDQCTDISVTPTNGTPPYTFTVAPSLHPPYNITSQDMSAINWTVSLSWGMPFFISLVDSTGMTWASGPLHSGGGGSTGCLALNTAESTSKTISPRVAIGSGVGGFFAGLAIGLLSAFGYLYWTRRHRPQRLDSARKSAGMLITSSPIGHYRDLPTETSRDGLMRDTSYHIEPFVMPSEQEFGARPGTSISPSGTSPTTTSGGNMTHSFNALDDQRSGSGSSPSVTATTAQASSSSPEPPRPPPERASSHVYVVHHDGGRAPISVYTDDGAEVVELPPRYVHGSRPTISPSPLSSQQTSRPEPLPEKPPPARHVVS